LIGLNFKKDCFLDKFNSRGKSYNLSKYNEKASFVIYFLSLFLSRKVNQISMREFPPPSTTLMNVIMLKYDTRQVCDDIVTFETWRCYNDSNWECHVSLDPPQDKDKHLFLLYTPIHEPSKLWTKYTKTQPQLDYTDLLRVNESMTNCWTQEGKGLSIFRRQSGSLALSMGETWNWQKD